MRKIFFYIHKTGILDYFINPICKFLTEKYDITILHLNKRNGFPDKKYDNLHLIDISDYSSQQIIQLLQENSPSLFVLPGFISIYELYMLRMAKMLGIPTLFLEHGIYSQQTANIAYNKVLSTQAFHVIHRNLYFLYRYLELACKSRNWKEEMTVLYRAIRRKDYSSTQFSRAMFFAPYGYEHINSHFGYKENQIEYIGYPLVDTNQEYNRIQQLATNNLHNGTAIYIHQPFIKDMLTRWDYNREKEMLTQLNNEVKQQGLSLTVSLHPRESIEHYKQLYSDTDITIKYVDNKEEYAQCSLAIGHYSTALIYPLFFEKPIWIIDYDTIQSSKESPFSPANTYPLIQVENNREFKYNIIGNEVLSFENIAQHIDQYITTL